VSEKNWMLPGGPAHVVTPEDEKAPWHGRRGGEFFRCNLCGHRFKAGDVVRFVYGNMKGRALGNILVCKPCDDSAPPDPDPVVADAAARLAGHDSVLLDRWEVMEKEAKERFWYFTKEYFSPERERYTPED
jgi:hypothetical protein